MLITASRNMPVHVQVLLGEGFERHIEGCRLLQMLQCLQDAFTAEAVQRPEQHQVELVAVGGVELRPVGHLAGAEVNVFMFRPELPTLTLAVFL